MLALHLTEIEMEKHLSIAWLFATIVSWISFSVASWFLADDFEIGTLVLTILWFVMSLVLFGIGMRLRKPS
jgi:hypothetical protein